MLSKEPAYDPKRTSQHVILGNERPSREGLSPPLGLVPSKLLLNRQGIPQASADDAVEQLVGVRQAVFHKRITEGLADLI